MVDGEVEGAEKKNDQSMEENIDEGGPAEVVRADLRAGRGRLVRQVATVEPEEIRSPSCCHPPDLSQVIFFLTEYLFKIYGQVIFFFDPTDRVSI